MSTIQQHEMPVFTPLTFPGSDVVKRNVVEYKKGARIFTQGDASKHVLYIQQGGVKLSVVNKGGKEAVVAILGPGDFFGEKCMSGLPFRMSTATAITGTTVHVHHRSLERCPELYGLCSHLVCVLRQQIQTRR